MDYQVSVRSIIHKKDIALLESKCREFFSSKVNITCDKGVDQIDSGFIALTSDIIASAAAMLYLYMTLKPKKLSYNSLKDQVRDYMATKGVVNVEIIEIANFRDRGNPCVVTLRDTHTEQYYKLFYSNHGNICSIKIRREV